MKLFLKNRNKWCNKLCLCLLFCYWLTNGLLVDIRADLWHLSPSPSPHSVCYTFEHTRQIKLKKKKNKRENRGEREMKFGEAGNVCSRVIVPHTLPRSFRCSNKFDGMRQLEVAGCQFVIIIISAIFRSLVLHLLMMSALVQWFCVIIWIFFWNLFIIQFLCIY